MWQNGTSALLLLTALPLVVAGCETSTGDDDDYFVASPTETPTPAPTATPTPSASPTADPNAGYRISTLSIEEDDGVDLSGNGRVDNTYFDTLSDVGKEITNTFEDACVTALSGVELPDTLPTDNPTLLCKSASVALSQALGALVSSDDFNTNLASAMSEVEYLEKVATPSAGNLDLYYYWGTSSGGTYYLGDLISKHGGTVDANGKAKLGPGTFTMAIALGPGGLTYLELVKARTELVYSNGSIGGAKLGGVLTEEALVNLLIGSITATVPLPDPVIQALSGVLGNIIPDCGTADTVMEDCDDLGGISMGFSFIAEAASVQ